MKKLFNLLMVTLLPLVSLFATEGYEVRSTVHHVDYENAKLYVDLEIRANDAASTFNLSDMNLRFTLGKGLANPAIAQELQISKVVTVGGTNSLYNPHTLKGTTGNIVSYNVVLAGGEGYPIQADNYISIGRIVFDIVDFNECLSLSWNRPGTFPPTFIGGKTNADQLISVDEGNFNAFDCVNARLELDEENLVFDVFPNPGDQFVNVQLNEDIETIKEGTLSVFNSVGKLVIEYNLQEAKDSNIRVNTKSWTPGLYIVKWNESTAKFVIAH